MAGLAAFISKAKASCAVLRHPHTGRHARAVPGWVLAIQARAKAKAWPFNTPEPHERDEWYFDGERYRRRGEQEQEAEGDDRTNVTQKSSNTSGDDETSTCHSAPSSTPPPSLTSVNLRRGFKTQNFELTGYIGKGGDGVVWLFTSPTSGIDLAAKQIDVEMIQGKCRPPHEYVVLKHYLQCEWHPNIIKVQSCVFDTNNAEALVFMEYCAGGSVENLVQQAEEHGEVFSTEFLMHFIVSMAEALGFLHEGLRLTRSGKVKCYLDRRPVVHRDIRLANILLRPDPSGQRLPDLVLADFGAALPAARGQGMYGDADAVRCAGPDIEMQGGVTPASDIYTLGVCVARLLACGKGEEGRGLAAAYDTSELGETAFTFEFLLRCLSVDARERPSAHDLMGIAGRLRTRLG